MVPAAGTPRRIPDPIPKAGWVIRTEHPQPDHRGGPSEKDLDHGELLEGSHCGHRERPEHQVQEAWAKKDRSSEAKFSETFLWRFSVISLFHQTTHLFDRYQGSEQVLLPG